MSLPTGTLTFLFTDIEGSTKLWEQNPEAMRQALERHNQIIIAAVERQGGQLVRTRGEGDSTFSVFPLAQAAVAAACAFQRALAAEPWPAQAAIRVRAALHTGSAHQMEGDYNSSDVNRCARLRAIAHGGQTLLSQTVYDLARHSLSDEVTLRDLGLHRLKDLRDPEHVYQLCHPQLRTDFPPLASLEGRPNNLPRQITSFVGREKEIPALITLLQHSPLITLTGAGGTGKTRLALQVGAERLEQYSHGVWLVELAALSDPALVPQAVLTTLGLREEPGRAAVQTLLDYLRERELLLVLDNCEHLVAACAALADTLLKTCPRLAILATSRAPLHVAGERAWRVPSLAVPDPQELSESDKENVAVLLKYDAMRLFVERARIQQPSFLLTSSTIALMAEIVRQLDGIPLALELAASRLRTMTIDQLAARLDDRFRLLTGGPRTALPRQQTLRALIDWSYDLLEEPEKTLFARLSVFSGGWTLEAAEQVCASSPPATLEAQRHGEEEGKGEREKGKEEYFPLSPSHPLTPSFHHSLTPSDILDLLASLVDKSLVLYEEHNGEARYRMLETVRQYAQEKFALQEDRAIFRRQHRDVFLALAEQAQSKWTGPEQSQWLDRLETEQNNLRQALIFCRVEPGEVVAGLWMAATLWRFWEMRGYLFEGREILMTLLTHPGAHEPTIARAAALNGAGTLNQRQGDYRTAQALFKQSLEIARALADRRGISVCLHNLGNLASRQGDYIAAQALLEESMALDKETGNKQNIAIALNSLGNVVSHRGDYAAARVYYQESLQIARELGDRQGIAQCLTNLATNASEQGDFDAARSLNEESLAIKRELGDRRGMMESLNNLGNAAYRQGDYAAASALHAEGLKLCRELGDKQNIALALYNQGAIACEQGDHASARIFYRESLAIARELGDRLSIAYSLEAFADLAAAESQMALVPRLYAAAEMLRQAILAPLPPSERPERDRAIAQAKEVLGDGPFQLAWEEGRAMILEQAVAYVLEEPVHV